MSSRDVYRALWARKFFIALATLAVAAAGWYLTSRQEQVYKATTLVRVQQRIKDPAQAYTAIVASQKLAQTYADLVGTRTIARRIYDGIDRSLPFSQIAGHISGEAVTDLDLLKIHVRGADPASARLIARAAPAALAAYVHATSTVDIEVAPAELAALPTTPLGASKKRNALFAFILGLVLNSGLVLAWRAVRDPVDGIDDLQHIVGAPVLVTIPPLRFARRRGAARPTPREVLRRAVEARELPSA